MLVLESKWNYRVSEYGDVWRQDGKKLKQTLRKKHKEDAGYYVVGLRIPIHLREGDAMSQLHRIHRLVALAFVPNPRPDIFTHVDHIDGNQFNNHYTNLRWLTHQLNLLNRPSAVGVKFDKRNKRWSASLQGKYLGCFKTYQPARKVYVAARDVEFNRLYNEALTGKSI